MSKKVKLIIVSDHLNVAVFDEAGQQVPELQVSLIQLLYEHLQAYGYTPVGAQIETPGGKFVVAENKYGQWLERRDEPCESTS